jgi:hypothetical protein
MLSPALLFQSSETRRNTPPPTEDCPWQACLPCTRRLGAVPWMWQHALRLCILSCDVVKCCDRKIYYHNNGNHSELMDTRRKSIRCKRDVLNAHVGKPRMHRSKVKMSSLHVLAQLSGHGSAGSNSLGMHAVARNRFASRLSLCI